MGIPSRFAIEYPQRALRLIEMLERQAEESELLGSFGLLAASAVLTIPYERMQSRHFLHKPHVDSDLVQALKELKRVAFLRAPFWDGAEPGFWWQSRIVSRVQNVADWLDEDGHHPLSGLAVNEFGVRKRKADDVVRVLRNALAHGNIIYLDREFREIAGRRMAHMAFLSRYEETEEQRETSETYRVVVTREEDFLRFVKCWARWIERLGDDGAIAEAA